MPSPLQVTITGVCNTSNNSARLSPSGNNQIQWQATGQNSYTLTLPRGVFVGYDGTGTFDLPISGPGFQPASPLTLVPKPPAQTVSNYIYQNGGNCRTGSNYADGVLDPPPDIVIDGA